MSQDIPGTVAAASGNSNRASGMTRVEFVRTCLLGGAVVGSLQSRSAESALQDRYDDEDAMKKGLLWVSKWWTVEYRGRAFAVCLQEPPSYGQCRQVVMAWRRETDGAFSLVWAARTAGVGPVAVDVDEPKGSVSVRAEGETELKGVTIALFHLGGAAG